jgi:hypothetical protein
MKTELEEKSKIETINEIQEKQKNTVEQEKEFKFQ